MESKIGEANTHKSFPVVVKIGTWVLHRCGFKFEPFSYLKYI